mgnify:CR=1 FL=1
MPHGGGRIASDEMTPMGKTKIEWCDYVFNGWSGCTKVSPGCAHCYAEALSKRAPKVIGQWGPGAPRRRTSADYWKEPVKWNKRAGLFVECGNGHRWQAKHQDQEGFCPECGHPESVQVRPRVFCLSLGDWLDPEVPIAWLGDMLNVWRLCTNLNILALTKRPELWRSRIEAVSAYLDAARPLDASGTDHDCTQGMVHAWLNGTPPDNVWIGASVEDQPRADERIPELLAIPARVRFLSCEPLLSGVDLSQWIGCYQGRAWSDKSGGKTQQSCNSEDSSRVQVGAGDTTESCRSLRGSVPDDLKNSQRRNQDETERSDGELCEPTKPSEQAPKQRREIHQVICGGESGPKARPMHPDWARSLRDQCAAAGVPFFFKQIMVDGRMVHLPMLDGRQWKEFPHAIS